MYPNSPGRAYLYDAGSGLHTKGNNEKLKYIQSSTKFFKILTSQIRGKNTGIHNL